MKDAECAETNEKSVGRMGGEKLKIGKFNWLLLKELFFLVGDTVGN